MFSCKQVNLPDSSFKDKLSKFLLSALRSSASHKCIQTFDFLIYFAKEIITICNEFYIMFIKESDAFFDLFST